MNTEPNPTEKPAPVDSTPLRPHVFDGIGEYDNPMPNWWLFTFWTMVAFAFGYWVWSYEWQLEPHAGEALKAEMAANTELAARRSGMLSDDVLWKMSRDRAVTQAGAATFTTTCASCHMADLAGGIGPNLKDTQWIHGGLPLEIMSTIDHGVLAKGMPTWGPILGKQKITEVVAFILSFHNEGEAIEKVPGWTPLLPGAPQVGTIIQPVKATP